MDPDLKTEDFLRVMSCLSVREAAIILLRYAPSGRRPRTLAQIGLTFGVTKERVRQIEKRALRRLRETIKASASRAPP